MKLTYLACIICFLVCYSCEKEVDNDVSFVIHLNECQEKNLNNETVRLCLKKIQDSRCCSKCYCVWAGMANASFNLYLKGENIPFELATINMGPTYKTDTVLNGYKIKLLNVSPYPGEGNDDPRVTVEVTRQ